MICNKDCNARCVCIDGYVEQTFRHMTEDKKLVTETICIPETQCPKTSPETPIKSPIIADPLCPKYSVWNDCASGCGPKTCENKDTYQDKICPEVCKPSCVCIKGFVAKSSTYLD